MLRRCWCRPKRSDSRAANCVTISLKAFRGANINAVFAPNADRESPERNLRQAIHRSSESWLPVSMIQAGFVRRWIFSCATRNRGIKWTPRFRNSSNTHRNEQTNKSVCKRSLLSCGSTVRPKMPRSFTLHSSKTRRSEEFSDTTKRRRKRLADQWDRC